MDFYLLTAGFYLPGMGTKSSKAKMLLGNLSIFYARHDCQANIYDRRRIESQQITKADTDTPKSAPILVPVILPKIPYRG